MQERAATEDEAVAAGMRPRPRAGTGNVAVRRPDRWLAALLVLALHVLVIGYLRLNAPERVRVPEQRIEVVFIAPDPVTAVLSPETAEPAESAEPATVSQPLAAATVRRPPASADAAPAPTAAPESPDVATSPVPNASSFRLFRPDGGLFVDEGLSERAGEAAAEVVEWKIANLDQAGRFNRPPPIDYEPTRFDAYWVPEESVLEEWVRRGVKDVYLPIPGSTWRVHCMVSLLVPGGACGIVPAAQDSSEQPLPRYQPPPNWNR